MKSTLIILLFTIIVYSIKSPTTASVTLAFLTTDNSTFGIAVTLALVLLTTVLFSSLFANAVDNLKEIRDTFSVSVGYQPKDVKEQPEGEQSAS